MKKSKKVIEWLDTGIFPCLIQFSCGFTHDEVVTILKKKKAQDWLVAFEGDDLFKTEKYLGSKRIITHSKTGEEKILFYIFLKDRFTFSDWDMIMLAHEVLHICQFMLPDILDRDKETEAEAYLHSHIMTQCLKALRK